MAKPKNTGGSAGSTMKRFYIVLAVVALAGVAGLGYAVLGSGGTATVEPVELEGADDPQALLEKAQGVSLGDPQAPVQVVEFGDYQCPGCGTFAGQVKPRLEEDYVNTGQVHFVFYDFPLVRIHQHAFLAARAARCAGDQGGYWSYHDRLFGAQSRWARERDAVDEFVEYAGEVGLDEGDFESCLRSDRHADVVTASQMLAEQVGVAATPTVIVNGQAVQNPIDYEALTGLIEQELEG